MEVRVSLCPACDHCPAVLITHQGVSIGEAENTVRLTHAEWQELVQAIRRGDLDTVNEPPA